MDIKKYMSFIKIEHTLFSLPIIFAGSILAGLEKITLKDILLIFGAGFGARTFALSVNRIIDHKIDLKNPRTRDRELPSGKMKLMEGIFVALSGLIIYLLSAYMLCKLCFYLSPIPLLIFTIYPYMKRFTYLCHFGVGLSLAMAPLGGYLAIAKSLPIPIPVWLLFTFTLFWVSGFDIIYATLDIEFDRKNNIYSIPAKFGKKTALKISLILHILAALSLGLMLLYIKPKALSIISLFVVYILLYIEHKKSEDVDLAFFKINSVLGFFVFFFILFSTV